MRHCGLVSVSFRNKTPEEIVEAMHNSKLSEIEWGSDVHAPFDQPDKLNNIFTLCNNYKINISSYGSYFRIGKNKPEELHEYIKAAKMLGTEIIRIWCGTKGYKEYSDTEFEEQIFDCRAIADIAKKNNITVCMECHNDTVTDCAEGALTLMKKVNCVNFRMYWQPNQYMTTQENLEYAKLISPYTKVIHVFNWAGDKKYPLEEAFGTWQKYLMCFSKDIPLLLEFMPDDNIKSLEREAKTLFNITKGLY